MLKNCRKIVLLNNFHRIAGEARRRYRTAVAISQPSRCRLINIVPAGAAASDRREEAAGGKSYGTVAVQITREPRATGKKNNERKPLESPPVFFSLRRIKTESQLAVGTVRRTRTRPFTFAG
ncbi:hypothetical protein EVAR_51193_1 [Eumeta japonica]|uniref:Uncharacterized protein n=1 Tax=Eumeta variegata TaxID=151549 RepID=A0A4C1XD91_EUMVA|nr:hypothetical protein EVAR_51193_1 [Eumeta japonica]